MVDTNYCLATITSARNCHILPYKLTKCIPVSTKILLLVSNMARNCSAFVIATIVYSETQVLLSLPGITECWEGIKPIASHIASCKPYDD